MTEQRWKELMDGCNADGPNLNLAETAQGWHWCYEFDGLLRQPSDAHDPNTDYRCHCLDNTSGITFRPTVGTTAD